MRSITKIGFSFDSCMIMAEAAMRKAREIKINIAITFVDESGVLKAFFRMDHSPFVSIDASRKKAITAVGLGISSGDSWYSLIKDNPILFYGVQQFEDFILLGGGSPVMLDDLILGAIGISGGHYKQDEECIEEAIKAFNSMNS
jgi:uncharacterized protein GlcG (DUF336 family)